MGSLITTEIPAHVPPGLVRDFDFVDMRGETDVYVHFSRLHDGPAIIWSPHHGGHWIATRFEDMDHILGTPATYSSRHQTVPPMPITLTLIEWDGALHAEARTILAPYFSPKVIGDLEAVARDLTISLIDGFIATGECEFVRDFAQKMPIIIIMNLTGLPSEDTTYLLGIAEAIVRSVDPAVQGAAFGDVMNYFARTIIPARRAKPGDDMLSAIMNAKIDGGRAFTEDEIISFGTVLVAAGLDTVASMLGYITRFLAENPGHRQQLIDDPGLINDAVEELIRRFHLANIARVVAHDVDYKGVSFKEGDYILIPTAAAGIDPSRYDDPFKVDFRRREKRPLVFGRGVHQCIGAVLARTELRVFLREWLKRIPQFRIKAGETPVTAPGKANCVRYLPLTWSAG
jgi:cytochrome P450